MSESEILGLTSQQAGKLVERIDEANASRQCRPETAGSRAQRKLGELDRQLVIGAMRLAAAELALSLLHAGYGKETDECKAVNYVRTCDEVINPAARNVIAQLPKLRPADNGSFNALSTAFGMSKHELTLHMMARLINRVGEYNRFLEANDLVGVHGVGPIIAELAGSVVTMLRNLGSASDTEEMVLGVLVAGVGSLTTIPDGYLQTLWAVVLRSVSELASGSPSTAESVRTTADIIVKNIPELATDR